MTTSTVAGGGTGEGLPATSFPLRWPHAVATGPGGEVYVTDNGVDGVCRVAPDGTRAVVATGCQAARTVAGGPGAVDGIHHPGALATAGGSLVVADAWAGTVWRVDGEDTVAVLAAGARPGGAEVRSVGSVEAVVPWAGGLLLADTWADRLVAVGPDGATAVVARLRHPTGLAVGDDGTVWVAAAGGLRRLRPDGDLAPVPLDAPWPLRATGGLAAGPDGTLYLADPHHHRVARLDPDGRVTAVAGTGRRGGSGDGGPAADAQLHRPVGVAVGDDGTVYIADSRNARLRAVRPDGTIDTVAGNGSAHVGGDGGPAVAAVLHRPRDVAATVRRGRPVLAVADTGNGRLRTVEGGAIATLHATAGGEPSGVAALAAGRLVVADAAHHRVWLVEADGTRSVLAGTGEPGYGGDAGPATAARLHRPAGVAVLRQGSVLVADSRNHRIRIVAPGSIIATLFGGGRDGEQLAFPEAVAEGASGAVYIADTFHHRVLRLDPDAAVHQVAGTGAAGDGGDGGPADRAPLRFPAGLAVGTDADGRDVVYVADTYNHRVRRIDGDGVVTTVAGTGEPGPSGLSHPRGLALRGRTLLVADTSGDRVVAVELPA